MNKRIRLFYNRQLAESLSVNLARWKRWSLAFLPPDPLSGKQSGHARQYYAQDAFLVHLGGHLVGDMGFSVQESQRILEDLKPHLAETQFGFDARAVPQRFEMPHPRRSYRLAITRTGFITFRYVLMAIVDDSSCQGDSSRMRCRRYREQQFASPQDREIPPGESQAVSSCRELDLSGVYWQFSNLLALTD